MKASPETLLPSSRPNRSRSRLLTGSRAGLFALLLAGGACGGGGTNKVGANGGSGDTGGSGGSTDTGGSGGSTGGSTGTGGATGTGGSAGGSTGTGGSGDMGGAGATGGSGDTGGAGGSAGGTGGAVDAAVGGAGGMGGTGVGAGMSSFGDPCTDMPDMMPPALKKTPVAMVPAQPGQIVGPPGESIIYVLGHKDGNVYAVQGGKVAGSIVHVDLQLNSNDEQGLLSMALHPDFAKNGLFYLLYTAAGGGNIRIEEFQRMSPMMAKSTGKLVFDQKRAGGGSFHNGGSIYFDPKDDKPFLYHSAGNNLNQGESAKPDGVAGRILRHDVDAKTHMTYAYGNRNPYRMSIDRLTGNMWISDTGDPPGGVIYFLAHGTKDGTNFGYGGGGDVGTKFPSMGGHQGGGGGIVGGVVYRGHKIKGLCGRYFFGMWNTGVIRSMIEQDGKVVGGVFNHDGALSVPKLTAFGEDGEGEIYMSSQNGPVYKLEAAGN